MAEATSWLDPLCGCLESTGMLEAATREVAAFLRVKANWSDLEKARDSLRAVETAVRTRVAEEEDKLNVCDPQVQLWLRRVDELQLDNTIDEDYGSLLEFSCLCQCTVHARRRAWIGKRVVEALEEVKDLTEEGRKFKKFGFKPPPEIVNHLPHKETFGLESMLTRLHDFLENGDSRIIGIWGQGGIGKTTLLHVFNNDLEKKAGGYQVVIFIEVSNSETLNTVEIQQTITDRLNLPWDESETVEKRAKFLVKALARKRFVVLLDDVRKKFRLKDVGIPTPDTNSQSKLILTSRYQEVCFQMGAQRNCIEMQVLDNDAAWKLFLSKLSNEACAAVESSSSNNVVRERAMEIFSSCGGLPLALNVIGTTVAGLEGSKEWISAAGAINNNMYKYSNDGVDEMFYRLKYSYDRLTPTQQQFFLYCTLFPEYGSINKDQLVDYWLAEGLLLNDRENGYQIIRDLISSCLLQTSGSMSSKVKMHHIIRHLGLWLVNKTDQSFLIEAGMAMDSAPSAPEWKEATRISIMSNDIKELSFSPKCRSLTTLLIQNNPNLNKLSWGFFKFMPTLKVLDLSHTAITSLPECETLVALQHLNLSHTLITRLPERLWLLKELTHLDLSVTVALEDTLNNCSKLLKLRVLNLFRSHYGIHDVDDLNLDSLKALMFLGITIYSEDVLKKLNKTSPLAKSTYRLNLKYCGEMQSIKISDLNHLVRLEELYVESCYDLNTLVADAELTTSGLEPLTLSVLPSLENVIVAPMPHHFQHTRKLVISKCPKLQNITWVLKLEMLERLVITHCDGMLKIVEEDNNADAEAMPDHPSGEQEGSADEWNSDGQSVCKSDSTNGKTCNGFPKLRLIVLTDVKKLRNICKPRDLPSLETIRVEDCPNLKSIPLSSRYNCGKLKQVCGSVEACSVENCGVSDQAFHGKSQRCDSDVKPFCAEVNGVSSLIGNHTDGKASKENCGAYNFTYDHADALVEDVKVAVARPGHAESAYPDGALTAKNGSCMAVDDLPQEFEREHAGATLDELFFSNDEEEDDSDWDPTSSLVVNRWFCLNCTMPNVDEITHCMNCHELKGSVVGGYNAFKTQIAQAALVSPDTELPPVSTAIGFDERMLLHSEQLEIKPNPHPERPDRLRAIAASLAAAGIFPSKCALVPPREITKEELLMVHTPDHIESVEQTKNMLYSYFTSDTYANGHSACAAKLAAGLCADLASLIVSGRVHNGFALVRPPGHHAGVKQAMGFCLHNNAAVAALAAKRAGAKKVLIVDWDVHHGNGTQEIFDGDSSVLYISLHRHEYGNFYPGTGAADEVGILDGQGFSVNIPWSCGGVGDNDYIFAFQTVVLPIAAEFAPDITIISAGFDAARGDPLGCCDVTPMGYSMMTSLLSDCSKGKLLVILEGGYNLRSISSSATEVVKILVGESSGFQFETAPSKEGLKTVLQVLKIQQQFWPVLGPTYASLQEQQGSVFSKSTNKTNELKKRKHSGGPGPFWWKFGSKRLLYEALYEGHYMRKIKVSREGKAIDSAWP